MLQNPSLYSQN